MKTQEWIKKKARPGIPLGAFSLSEDGVYVPPYRNGLTHRIATFLDQFSDDKFPHVFPRLNGLFSELRSFRHRIALVLKRGRNCQIQIGYLQHPDSHPYAIIENARTQCRIRDIERLEREFPWASFEDSRVFLSGWNAGWESRGSLDTPETSGGTKRA
jgi:hypothetical protein